MESISHPQFETAWLPAVKVEPAVEEGSDETSCAMVFVKSQQPKVSLGDGESTEDHEDETKIKQEFAELLDGLVGKRETEGETSESISPERSQEFRMSTVTQDTEVFQSSGCNGNENCCCSGCMKLRRSGKEEQTSVESAHKCKICHKSYSKKSNLKAHEERHKGLDYACSFCMKSYSSRNGLISHQETHLGIQYKCQTCNKSYSNKRTLQAHVKLHEGVQYNCNICLKFFSRKGDLKEHQEIHKSVSYSCSLCLKSYRSKRNYQDHKRSHEDAYRCQICRKSFSRSCNLRAHEKNTIRCSVPSSNLPEFPFK